MSLIHVYTGKRRYRVHKRWFGEPLVILQVEIHVRGSRLIASTPLFKDVNEKYWRDATVQDLVEVG